MTLREFHAGTREYELTLGLREAVLRAPLGLHLSERDLADDADCLHFGGFDGDRAVAVLLLRPLDARTVKMRQVAVHPEFQGRGIGARLVDFAERAAREKGFTTIVAHARATAVEFYRKAGYVTEGSEFIETTVPHRLVSKAL